MSCAADAVIHSVSSQYSMHAAGLWKLVPSPKRLQSMWPSSHQSAGSRQLLSRRGLISKHCGWTTVGVTQVPNTRISRFCCRGMEFHQFGTRAGGMFKRGAFSRVWRHACVSEVGMGCARLVQRRVDTCQQSHLQRWAPQGRASRLPAASHRLGLCSCCCCCGHLASSTGNGNSLQQKLYQRHCQQPRRHSTDQCGRKTPNARVHCSRQRLELRSKGAERKKERWTALPSDAAYHDQHESWHGNDSGWAGPEGKGGVCCGKQAPPQVPTSCHERAPARELVPQRRVDQPEP